jgi:ATP-binding cassette, subfamily C (CFTR/MRP), member 1
MQILVLSFPIQIILVRVMFLQRRSGVAFTDKRVRLTSEILQGIRLLKAYTWEDFYADAVTQLRKKEIATIRRSS